VKERAYTGKGIFNVAGSRRSGENQTILGMYTSPSKNGNASGAIRKGAGTGLKGYGMWEI